MIKLPLALLLVTSCTAAVQPESYWVGSPGGDTGSATTDGTGDGTDTGSGSTAAAGCDLPWGGKVYQGTTVTAYGDPIAVGSKFVCPSESRTCTNGQLSGALANASCGSAPTHCELPWGGSIKVGESVTAYRQLYSSHCSATGTMETRTCLADGLLDGASMNTYPTCAPIGTNDCVFGGDEVVPYHTSLSVYASPHPVSGACTPQKIECVHGDNAGIEWSGAYNDRFTTCETGPTDCSTSLTADLSTPDGQRYTRRCASNVIVDHNNGAFAYNTDLSKFGEVFGYPAISDTMGWPGAFAGFTPTFTLSEHEFVSLAFTAGPARTINLVTNPSYSMPVAVTISRHPGVFSPTDPDVVCSTAGILTSSGAAGGATCVLSSDPGVTYYLNMAPYPGTDCSATGGMCPLGLGVYLVN